MTQLTDATKVSKVDAAFGELVKEYIADGKAKQAQKILNAFAELPPESLVRLFDILTK